ncbi:MAG: hypothetical protein D6815_12575 [Candidatus Dadabacteria bacterium]|nr:MAG: hypothetical protein D6815_12575 [Candidatus Dadabacteria bacterium]
MPSRPRPVRPEIEYRGLQGLGNAEVAAFRLRSRRTRPAGAALSRGRTAQAGRPTREASRRGFSRPVLRPGFPGKLRNEKPDGGPRARNNERKSVGLEYYLGLGR